jgi:Family of unknown function (DUF5670)
MTSAVRYISQGFPYQMTTSESQRGFGWQLNCTLAAWETFMLWTIFVVLLVLWLLGLVTSYTLGGFIHILLVVAIAVLLIQLITGRRVV